MGYRDMLLYGTQCEGNSMRGKIGVEVEPYEMLEMVRAIDTLEAEAIAEGVNFVKTNWVFKKECADATIEQGVKYALAILKKIRERGWEAITLLDVDGMKKLLGFPPAMVFMLLEHYCGVLTVPENDIMGAVTQLVMKYLSGQTVPYLEYYEFFENSMLIGVPDFVPKAATKGDVTVLPAAFGLLNSSLLNVSKVKTGYVTCARMYYLNGKYKMHVYTAEAKEPPAWNEYGWDDPAPQLVSLEVEMDSSVEEFADKVGCQHVIVTYGDNRRVFEDWAKIMGIEVI
jgi:L-arabinose isomerase